MQSGSRRRAPSMPPRSTVSQPNALHTSATAPRAEASFPQRNMVGGPPGNFGSTMCALPTVLKTFTTRAPGSQRWTCSPPESVWPSARRGGVPGSKTSGFVTSRTTLPLRFSTPASVRAFSVPLQCVARTSISPNAAASRNVPAEPFPGCLAAQAAVFSFVTSRAPSFTVCPRDTNPFPSAWPTSPLPRIPIFMWTSRRGNASATRSIPGGDVKKARGRGGQPATPS